MTAIPDILEMRTFECKLNDDDAKALANVSVLNPYGEAPLMRDLRARGYQTFGIVLIEELPGHPEQIKLIWTVNPKDDSLRIQPAPGQPEPDQRVVDLARDAVDLFIEQVMGEVVRKLSESVELAPEPTLH
jgi:hypothetical protein